MLITESLTVGIDGPNVATGEATRGEPAWPGAAIVEVVDIDDIVDIDAWGLTKVEDVDTRGLAAGTAPWAFIRRAWSSSIVINRALAGFSLEEANYTVARLISNPIWGRRQQQKRSKAPTENQGRMRTKKEYNMRKNIKITMRKKYLATPKGNNTNISAEEFTKADLIVGDIHRSTKSRFPLRAARRQLAGWLVRRKYHACMQDPLGETRND